MKYFCDFYGFSFFVHAESALPGLPASPFWDTARKTTCRLISSDYNYRHHYG